MNDDHDVRVVPAETGWNLLWPVTDDDGRCVEFHREPIVAWAVEVYVPPGSGEWSTFAQPVAADWPYPSKQMVIERPDGLITFVGDRSFDSEAEALAYANEGDE